LAGRSPYTRATSTEEIERIKKRTSVIFDHMKPQNAWKRSLASCCCFTAAIVVGLSMAGCGPSQAEQAALQQQKQEMERLRAENQDLAKLREANQEVQRLRKENQELAKLRGQYQQLQQLRKENEQLRNQLAKVLQQPAGQPRAK
jgi:predicted RNase H-like nuclease (RuvC/YqgF family)